MKFGLIAMFKNEAMAIREWLGHYKWQGVDRVLLLDNNSTDNWREKVGGLEGFVDVVPVAKNNAQAEHYNTIGMPWLRQHQIDIVGVVDMDEFAYATDGRSLKDHFTTIFQDTSVASVALTMRDFGSSGHVKQPASIRKGFTLRMRNDPGRATKCFSRVRDLVSLGIHTHDVRGKVLRDPPGLRLNHYIIQSREFFEKVKMSRGDSQHAEANTMRNWNYFAKHDYKDEEDTQLKTQVEALNQKGGRRRQRGGAPFITIYIVCFNEQLLLPFTVNYYKGQFPSSRIVICDNESTDNSVAIAKSLGCEIHTWSTGGKQNEEALTTLKNTVWKKATTDWVIICDMDELICATEAQVKEEDARGTTILKLKAYDVVGESKVPDLSDIALDDISKGVRLETYDKKLCFKRTAIQELNCEPGCHVSNPVGKITYSAKEYLLYHYKFLGQAHFVATANTIKMRRNSPHDIYGIPIGQFNDEAVKKKYNEILLKATAIPPLKSCKQSGGERLPNGFVEDNGMFICAELFQRHCQYNMNDRYPMRPWNPATLKEGERVFMTLEDIPKFLQAPPPKKVNMVVHNTDDPLTDEHYTQLAPYCINVFAENCKAQKGIQIPIGFRDDQYERHSVMIDVLNDKTVPDKKSILCLVNFNINPMNREARLPALNAFKGKPWATVQEEYMSVNHKRTLDYKHPETQKGKQEFFKTLKQTKFVISPPGAGQDCHRVYEALFFGATPIVISSFLDPMYQRLGGVLIVKSWGEVTEEFLNRAWESRGTPTLQTDPEVWLTPPQAGGAQPTFHILIPSIGRASLKGMLDSLRPQLTQGDAVTVVFDGPDAKAKSGITPAWTAGFAATVSIKVQDPPFRNWGHAIQNEWQTCLEPNTTFIMHADDDDQYLPGAFDAPRRACTDPETLYIAKMKYRTQPGLVIPRQDSAIVLHDIGTPNGIIPFSKAGEAKWGLHHGGDFTYYNALKTKVSAVKFLPDIIYEVLPAPKSRERPPQAGGRRKTRRRRIRRSTRKFRKFAK